MTSLGVSQRSLLLWDHPAGHACTCLHSSHHTDFGSSKLLKYFLSTKSQNTSGLQSKGVKSRGQAENRCRKILQEGHLSVHGMRQSPCVGKHRINPSINPPWNGDLGYAILKLHQRILVLSICQTTEQLSTKWVTTEVVVLLELYTDRVYTF